MAAAHTRVPGSGQELVSTGNRARSELCARLCGLGKLLHRRPDYSPFSGKDMFPKAREAAQKALDIDDSLADAHLALAGAEWTGLNFKRAEGEFQKALALSPNYADAHHWYGLFLSWEARNQEGLYHLQRAVELEPLNLQYNANLGQGLSNAGQFDEAVAQLKKTIENRP